MSDFCQYSPGQDHHTSEESIQSITLKMCRRTAKKLSRLKKMLGDHSSDEHTFKNIFEISVKAKNISTERVSPD